MPATEEVNSPWPCFLAQILSVVMPVSMEQWRASVGLNNASRSRALITISPNHILEKILLSQIGWYSLFLSDVSS